MHTGAEAELKQGHQAGHSLEKTIASAKALGQVPTCIVCSGNRNEAGVAGG